MEVVLNILFISLIVFGVGGVIYMFVKQHLETKRYIEWIDHLENLDR